MNPNLIQVKIPVGENKEETFEQFLINLHEVLTGIPIGLEVASIDQHVYFFCRVPANIKTAVEGQIYALYPHAEVSNSKEYIRNPQSGGFAAAELYMARNDIYPIQTHTNFDGDSLAGIFSILSKAESGEEAWIQTVIEPLKDDFKLNFSRSWKIKMNGIKRWFRFKDRFKLKGVKNLRAQEKAAFDGKAEKRAFKVGIRVAYIAPTQEAANNKLISLMKAYTQFNTIDFNQFKAARTKLQDFTISGRDLKFTRSMTMSCEEVASVYHFPNPDIVPHIVHVMSRKSEPPHDLPKAGQAGAGELSVFGLTNYHNQNIKFGIKRVDRRRHLYVVGKSGTGKSKFLELLIISDILSGKGVGVLDPHGDLVDAVLKYIPEERKDDVVVFDPGDDEFPIAFNPLEQVPDHLKLRVTIGFIEVFKKLFGNNWTNRLEHVLRYTTLALLDSPDTTVLSILKMLSDKNYRQRIVANIKDSVIKNFWVNEFAAWSEKFDNEAIMPLLNKVGQFVSTTQIRNIIGQPENKLNIRQLMDDGKILLMKISKGTLGEENCQLIGAMMVTKIHQAAMARSDTPEEQRRDFYLYCDEFQYFATDTFAEILSEARKYRLNLTMAHQYMGQLNDLVRTTVFGNVGSLMSFRVGAEDASILEQEYTPKFNVRDIINLGVREFYIKMSIDGQIRDAFSGMTINVPKPVNDLSEEIKALSRQKYCRPKAEVENILKRWEEGAQDGADINPADIGETEFTEPLI